LHRARIDAPQQKRFRANRIRRRKKGCQRITQNRWSNQADRRDATRELIVISAAVFISRRLEEAARGDWWPN
jgi:hypothetical protein